MGVDMLEGVDHILKHGNEATQDLWAAMTKLPTLFLRMSNLQTFSFSVRWEKYVVTPYGFWLEHLAIHRMVHALPPTLKNLELDTKAQENTIAADREYHICDGINSHLSHLEHVRLRLKRYCSKLFGPSYTLKSLSISLVEPLGWSVDNLRCDDDLEWFSGRQQQEAQRLGRRTRDALIESASGALEKLPSLQKLIITEVADSRDGSERLLLARDIKAGKTTAMPIFHEREKWIVGIRDLAGDGTFKDSVSGSIMNLTEAAEGDLWVTTETGSRFPAAYRDSADGRGHKWSGRSSYETKEQFLTANDAELVGLWEDEEEVGELLLEPKQIDGLGDVEPIFKGKTKHEREFGEDRDSDFELEFNEDGNQVDPTV